MSPLPRVGRPALAEEDLDDALDEALHKPRGDEPDDLAAVLHRYEPPPRSSRGQPARNRYLAAEVAYMLDIERRAPFVSKLHASDDTSRPFAGQTVRAYLRPDLALTSDEGLRSKTLTRWRDDGRQVMAALGAWPWTVVGPEGQLSRSWWLEARFAASLAAWHRGEA